MEKFATTRQTREAGMALLSALWLTLILGAIAFGVAAEVRSSAESTANNIAMSQAKYFAEGGINAAVAAIYAARGGAADSGQPAGVDEYRPGKRWLVFRYTAGAALVEVVPENAKLSANQLTAQQARALLEVLAPAAAMDFTAGEALQDWRSMRLSTVDSPHDAYYAQLRRPYRANHVAVQDLEELIAVRGFGRSMFYGPAETIRDSAPKAGAPLLEVLNAEAYSGPININFAPYQVLASLPSWDRQLAQDVVAARQDDSLQGHPFVSLDDLVRRVPAAASVVGVSSISLNSGNSFTLTATGLVGESGESQTVRALVRFDPGFPDGYRVQGWWDVWPWSTPPPAVLAELAAQEKERL